MVGQVPTATKAHKDDFLITLSVALEVKAGTRSVGFVEKGACVGPSR